MEGDARQEALKDLLLLAGQQGYVTFDNIMDCGDAHSLSIADFDWLSNATTTRGILVYDTPPSVSQEKDEDEDVDDYAQVDYEAIYQEIVRLDPSQEEFVDEVRSIRPPQFREVSQLKYLVQEKNNYARQRMIEMHLRIALRLALQRAKQYDMEIADALDSAIIGLIMAVDRYEPDTSGAFASYASLWILQNMSREQATQNPQVYFPVHRKEWYFACYPTLKTYGCLDCGDFLRCKKAAKMISDRVECSLEQVSDVLLSMVPFESIDMYLKNIEKFSECDECFQNTDAYYSYDPQDDWVAALDLQQLQRIMNETLATLKPREREVLSERFGLSDGREKTLEEVGEMLGVTRERIRQIEKKAISRMKHPSRAKKIKQ